MTRPTNPKKAAVLADYLSGYSGNEAAERHGVSTSTAHKWITRAGISRTNGNAKRLAATRKRDQELGYLGASTFDPTAWETRGGVLRPIYPARRSA